MVITRKQLLEQLYKDWKEAKKDGDVRLAKEIWETIELLST